MPTGRKFWGLFQGFSAIFAIFMDLGLKEKVNINIRTSVIILEFEVIPIILRPQHGQRTVKSINFKAIAYICFVFTIKTGFRPKITISFPKNFIYRFLSESGQHFDWTGLKETN